MLTIRGAFRTAFAGSPVNAYDTLTSAPVAYESVPTFGATLVDNANVGTPQINQKWKIVSLSVEAQLILLWGGTTTPPGPFGKLGGVIVGLATDETLHTTINQFGLAPLFPWQQGYVSPPDATLTTPLWDPANDPLPPTATGGVSTSLAWPVNALPVAASFLPPIPIPVVSGVQVNVALWIRPALYGFNAAPSNNYGLAVGYANYAIYIDDGS